MRFLGPPGNLIHPAPPSKVPFHAEGQCHPDTQRMPSKSHPLDYPALDQESERLHPFALVQEDKD